MTKQSDIVRYELICGQLTTKADHAERDLYRERHEQHERAKKIANILKINSHFEESCQHGTWHLDGYLYAPLSKAVDVLKALKKGNVEVDIADVPANETKISREIEDVDWALNIEPFTE